VVAALGGFVIVLFAIIVWMFRLLHKVRGRSDDIELGKRSSHHESAYVVPSVTSNIAEPTRTEQVDRASSVHTRFTTGDDFEDVELRGSPDNVRTAQAVSVMQVQKAGSQADVPLGAQDIIGEERIRSPEFLTLRTVKLRSRSRDHAPIA
jgi:hypothetical protein